jgi:transaldolase / glucose-6-phosphate isomerase
MAKNPLQKLADYGQSIWLDYIRRKMLDSGELKQMIAEDGLRGVTVNPSILEKAISGSHDYDSDVQALALEGKSEPEIYERLGVEDVQRAADLFRPLYEESQGKHGFVSLEVSPYLAHDTEGTIAEARRFWKELDRPNVFIKVPATIEGLAAIRELIRQGINVNVTLLFGLPRYREVAEAYIAGLEARADEGKPIDRLASVASFFLSRIDVLVDPILEEKMKAGGHKAEIAKKLHGQVAVASARVAYQIYKEIFDSERFKRLAEKGARTQRLLWASTSTKNPAYSDVKYVEALIGPETVNTAPPETLDAYRDHGDPAARIEENLDEAREVLDLLPELDIDIDEVTQQLEDEGVDKFAASYDRLMETLKKERQHALEEPIDRQSLSLGEYESSVKKTASQLEQQAFVTRLWRKDPSLWKSDPKEQEVISNALGWLHVAEKMEENLSILNAFRDELKEAGFKHVVHMGMGGSSLAPLVFERTFARSQKGIPLTVLDTTDPQTILKIEKEVPIADTLFIVASKSGTTAEPLAFCDYFYAKVKEIKGDQAGKNFIAITDPGTPLVKLAQERGFRRTFLNFADIGGRYSALSYFGLLPAALMGVDVEELLARALRMVHACVSCVDAENNPGLQLGTALGEIGRQGRNKVTFLVPESISTLGMWLEQLLAESTGKEGQGLLPVAGERIGDPQVYDEDRFFAYFRLNGQEDEELEKGVEALKEAGHPVVTIQMEDRLDLGQEFFRWEIATATAGAILGINAFNQPNVQESKDNTNRLLKTVREENELPREEPLLKETPLSLHAEEKKASTIADSIAKFLDQAKASDYIALMAYMAETADNERTLQEIRLQLRDSLHLASTLGYGPRFLHSTGQYHKGGPNNGLFLQLTVDEPKDAQIPEQPYTFGMLQRAQALGDLEALHKHGRRAIRIHLGTDANQGLEALQKAVLSTAAVQQ